MILARRDTCDNDLLTMVGIMTLVNRFSITHEVRNDHTF